MQFTIKGIGRSLGVRAGKDQVIDCSTIVFDGTHLPCRILFGAGKYSFMAITT